MKIYTKTGDTGETGLYGGTRIPKDSLRVEAIGTVDELNACIGYAMSQIRDTEIDAVLERVQNELFDLGADLEHIVGANKHPVLRDIQSVFAQKLLERTELVIDRYAPAAPLIFRHRRSPCS